MPDGTSRSEEHAVPHPGATGSLWRLPAMRLLALYTLFGFTGFFATISALPAWIARNGTSESLAGFVTTTLLVATVSTQSIVPRLVARFGMTATLAIGLFALGAPALLFLVDGGYVWVLAICAVRGVGFGAMTVLGAMLTARLVPPTRRGEAIGIYGLAIAVPNLLAVPGGVALVSAGHFAVVAVLGAVPLLGLPVVRALARAAEAHAEPDARLDGSPSSGATSSGTTTSGAGATSSAAEVPAAAPGTTSARSGLTGAASGATSASSGPTPARSGATAGPVDLAAAKRSRRAARTASIGPAIVLMVVTLTSGGFMTYVPIMRPDGALATVALLVWGAVGALTRWRIGVVADRSGLRRLLPGASVLSIVGICVVASGLLLDGPGQTAASWIVILTGSVILGMGFGGTQNLTLLAAFMRAKQRETATVSSVWNIGFDTGTAIGSGLVGLLILAVTIPSALALTSLLVLASIPLAIRSARPPGAEYCRL